MFIDKNCVLHEIPCKKGEGGRGAELVCGGLAGLGIRSEPSCRYNSVGSRSIKKNMDFVLNLKNLLV